MKKARPPASTFFTAKNVEILGLYPIRKKWPRVSSRDYTQWVNDPVGEWPSGWMTQSVNVVNANPIEQCLPENMGHSPNAVLMLAWCVMWYGNHDPEKGITGNAVQFKYDRMAIAVAMAAADGSFHQANKSPTASDSVRLKEGSFVFLYSLIQSHLTVYIYIS